MSIRLGLGVATATLVLDRISKLWLIDLLRDVAGGIELTPFFNLVMVWNRGISFGLLNSGTEVMRWVLLALSLAISAFLVVWLWRATSAWLAAALGLVIGGALSNAGDRLAYGAVADFLDFHLYGYHWPAFNLADSAIVVGVAGLLLDSLFAGRDKSGKKG